MLERRDILIFAGDWGWFPSVMERIAERLLPLNRILWVGSLSMRRPRLRMYDLHRVADRLKKILIPSISPATKNGPHPTAFIHPLVLPFYDIPGVKKVNDMLVGNIVRKKIQELGFRDVIVFTATPLVADIIGTFGETSHHYFCLDDYSEYDGAYHCIRSLEERLLERIDSCFALSEPLLQTRKAKSGENHFLPMGVDTEHFSLSETPPPAELRNIHKPIAGFFGQIASYVDIDLMVRCAKAYPGVSFVVIGRALVDLSAFAQAKNIFYIGEVPYANIPRYACTFDVGLNPRVLNNLTRAMNPLKVLEYLSLGIPVVSTDLPEVRKFKDYVYIASSGEHFVELLGIALGDTNIERKMKRRQIAEQFSWNTIVRHVSEIIGRIDRTKHMSQQHEDIVHYT